MSARADPNAGETFGSARADKTYEKINNSAAVFVSDGPLEAASGEFRKGVFAVRYIPLS